MTTLIWKPKQYNHIPIRCFITDAATLRYGIILRPLIIPPILFRVVTLQAQTRITPIPPENLPSLPHSLERSQSGRCNSIADISGGLRIHLNEAGACGICENKHRAAHTRHSRRTYSAPPACHGLPYRGFVISFSSS